MFSQKLKIASLPFKCMFFSLFPFRFAASLVDLPVWVMNVVPIDMPDTLTTIFDRGLIGLYHDWCESLSTYPRTYDLVHASFLFKHLEQRYAYRENHSQ